MAVSPETTYRGREIVAEDGENPTLTIDGSERELQIDAQGSTTQYSHESTPYQYFDNLLALGEAIVDAEAGSE